MILPALFTGCRRHPSGHPWDHGRARNQIARCPEGHAQLSPRASHADAGAGPCGKAAHDWEHPLRAGGRGRQDFTWTTAVSGPAYPSILCGTLKGGRLSRRDACCSCGRCAARCLWPFQAVRPLFVLRACMFMGMTQSGSFLQGVNSPKYRQVPRKCVLVDGRKSSHSKNPRVENLGGSHCRGRISHQPHRNRPGSNFKMSRLLLCELGVFAAASAVKSGAGHATDAHV